MQGYAISISTERKLVWRASRPYPNSRANDFDTDEVVEFVAPTEVEFEMEIIDSLQQRQSVRSNLRVKLKSSL